MIDKIDLAGIRGIYVTESPRGTPGPVMWCGYCRTRLHYDHRHLGVTPFLTLMVKMAEAHRETDCSDPQGPMATDWHPHMDEAWGQPS